MYNLLLVDDEPLIKVAFQSAVEWGKNGFLLAATASNGQEALHIVETQHIDAVITDLKMPGMDGLALIHELKKRSFIGPILVLSNYSDFDSVRAALTDGAYDYFLKINMNAPLQAGGDQGAGASGKDGRFASCPAAAPDGGGPPILCH